MINSFSRFYHLQVVFLKAFSKAPEFCRCPTLVRDREVSGSKPCQRGLYLDLKNHAALNRTPCESPWQSKFDSLWPLFEEGNIQFPLYTGKSCYILLLRLLMVFLLLELQHLLCPHWTASHQLPASQSPTCSTDHQG